VTGSEATGSCITGSDVTSPEPEMASPEEVNRNRKWKGDNFIYENKQTNKKDMHRKCSHILKAYTYHWVN